MKKRKMKKAALLLVTSALLAAALGGCGKKEEKAAADSVFTGDSDALQVFVRNGATYPEEFLKKFPDIKFDFYYYGGLNGSMCMNQLLEEDDFGDICISSLQAADEVAKEHLLELSGYDMCGRYEPSVLSQFDVDGSIYQLPGYISMRNIVYNKDMFEKYGWEEPENFDDMLELCRAIRRDAPGITPIVMAGAANGYYFTTMTSYAQAEFLYMPEGQKWLKEYQNGTGKAEEGFGEGIRMTQELIDAGAFDYEANEGLWDAQLFSDRMMTGEAAMMFVWGGQSYVSQQLADNNEIEFGMIPFRNRKGQAFIGTNISYYVGLAKRLGEKGNEKKLEQAMRVIDWLSTEEGIQALSIDNLSAIMPLKGAEHEGALEINRQFWNEYIDAIKAPMLYSGFEHVLAPTADGIIEAVRDGKRIDGLAEYMDEIHGKFLEGGEEAVESGEFARDFTHEETVRTMAHILHSAGDSDITLVSDGTRKNEVLNTGGVFLKFFEGPIIEDSLTICLPGGSAAANMQQLTLTGKDVKNLLEKGLHRIMIEGDSHPQSVESHPDAIAEADFDYYWAGMDVEWKDGKVKSMKLSDGTALDDDRICTVSFAPEDYTAETAALGEMKELPYTAKDVMEKYMQENSPVSPVGES